MTTHPDHIQFLNPTTLAPTPGYSQVAQVTGGRTIYLAGQVALDASRNLVGRGDFRAQAQQVFENIKIALAAVGADFSHVVKLNYYLLDRSHVLTLHEECPMIPYTAICWTEALERSWAHHFRHNRFLHSRHPHSDHLPPPTPILLVRPRAGDG